jgi:hypothetical protein
MREGCCAAKAQTMRIRRRRGKPGSTPESRRRQKRRLPELDRRIEDEVEQGKSSKGEECGGEEESESSGGHHSDRKQ